MLCPFPCPHSPVLCHTIALPALRFLKTLDLSRWNAYGYPETDLLGQYRAAVNPLPIWFAELMEGDPTSYQGIGNSNITQVFASLEVASPWRRQ
jgi:hypothetical protein